MDMIDIAPCEAKEDYKFFLFGITRDIKTLDLIKTETETRVSKIVLETAPEGDRFVYAKVNMVFFVCFFNTPLPH